VIKVQDSVLDAVSYLAERYVVVRGGMLAEEMGGDAEVRIGDVETGELWLAAFKS
jgi:hypothetical protein